MTLVRILAFFFIVALAFRGYAEYRVFNLVIKNTENNTTKSFLSNLDPEQYKDFFPLKKSEVISYTSTWMCKGSTNGLKPLCSDPRTKLLAPSDQASDKASGLVPDRSPAQTPSLSPELTK